GLAQGAEEAAACPCHTSDAQDAPCAAGGPRHIEHGVRNGVPALAFVQGNVLEDLVHDVLLNAAVLYEEPRYGDDEDEQWKQRKERVIGDAGGQRPTVIPYIFGRRPLE